MGQLLNSIANIIGGKRLEADTIEFCNGINELRGMFRSSGNEKAEVKKHLYEVIYTDSTGAREMKNIEATSEYECKNELSRIIGRNDFRIMSIRRK